MTTPRKQGKAAAAIAAQAAALIDAFAQQYQADRQEAAGRERHRIFREWLTIVGLFLAAIVAFFQWRELRSTDHNIAKQAEIGAGQLRAMNDQLIEMRGSGKQTDFLIEANRRSADAAKEAAEAAKHSADVIANLERPYFFLLARVETKVSKEGTFDSVGIPALRYEITNLGRAPGILRMIYVRCYLQREKFPERPIVESGMLRPAQNPIAASTKGIDYPPCEFEKPFSKEDWIEIVANKAVPTLTAILVYEGPLDYTYTDTVSYKIDPFDGLIYPLGLEYYTSDQASSGRISKGATLTIPNILWASTPPVHAS